ncbi:heterokaryon incompatibility protein-domain-containing protein [Immersiella caudata]|uniref:Heterokaryon incompatibility protein-domain-containing protein n=1 Tax=Immersiella caudata TaxID=314043 RepID=A0AA39WQM3_9PEZI|nr:heterokaryon incompatibility protein-domain-containing protein [Immersiella caudata]
MAAPTGTERSKAWERCPCCKELFGGVYDKRVPLPDVLASASQCMRCWGLREVLGHVTNIQEPNTTLVGSIWHDNTLEIGVICPEDSFETAVGHKIYLVVEPEEGKSKRARLHPALGIPIAVESRHESFRPIGRSAGERFSLAKTWLSECLASHDTCNADAVEYALPRRLLDISDDGNIYLVPTEKHHLAQATPYVALSYCWGKDGGNLCTYTTNLDKHTTGIPIASLPQTIKDAILACNHLGQRYLWVDALCIIQDDPDDKITQIPQMADIYSGALLVLSAAGSPGVLEGCPLGPPEMQPVPPIVFELSYPLDPSTRSHEEGDTTGVVNVVIERMEHERCRSLPGHWARESFDQDPKDVLNVIEERGWTFQERFLAKRTLYIGKGEMSWTCASEVQCECRKAGPHIKTSEGDRVFTRRYNMSHVSVKKLFSNADMDKTYSFLWSDVVTMYSSRLLTQFSDRLAALEGVAVALQRRWPDIYNKDDYVFGCWRPLLVDLLAWQVAGDPVSAQIDRELFPSWAWPSCGRPVGFTSWLWYGVNPKTWAQVLDLEVERPKNVGAFGQGKGTITLRAPLIPATREVARYDDGYEEVVFTPRDTKLSFLAGVASLDHVGDNESAEGDGETGLVLLATYPFKWLKQGRPLSCALLCVAPVSGQDGVYRRVGMLTTPRAKRAFWGFHVQQLLWTHITKFKLV